MPFPRSLRLLTVTVGAASVLAFVSLQARSEQATSFDVQGCSYSSWSRGGFADPENATQLPALHALGINSLYVQGYSNVDRQTLRFYVNPQADDFDGLPQVLSRARALGLRTGVRVNLYSEAQTTLHDRSWRPADPGHFFHNYKQLVEKHARVAQDAGAELLILGQEMDAVTGAEYRELWLDIIRAARAIFSGKFTYGYLANLSVPPTRASLDDAVSFWDELDYIAMSAYPPLSFSSDGTVEDFRRAWHRSIYNGQNLIASMRAHHAITGKRVLLTEVGYRSYDGAAKNPANPVLDGPVDFQEQADLYSATLSVFEQETDPSWFAGMFLYNCATAMRPVSNYYGSDAGWGWRKGYAVDGKPAADVIRQFFRRR